MGQLATDEIHRLHPRLSDIHPKSFLMPLILDLILMVEIKVGLLCLLEFAPVWQGKLVRKQQGMSYDRHDHTCVPFPHSSTDRADPYSPRPSTTRPYQPGKLHTSASLMATLSPSNRRIMRSVQVRSFGTTRPQTI